MVTCFVVVASLASTPLTQGTNAVLVNDGELNGLSHTSTSLPRVPQTQIFDWLGLRITTGLVTFWLTVATVDADQTPPALRRSREISGSPGAGEGASFKLDLIATKILP